MPRYDDGSYGRPYDQYDTYDAKPDLYDSKNSYDGYGQSYNEYDHYDKKDSYDVKPDLYESKDSYGYEEPKSYGDTQSYEWDGSYDSLKLDDYDEPKSYDYTHKKEKDIGYKRSSYDKPYGFDSSKYIDQYTDNIYSISD